MNEFFLTLLLMGALSTGGPLPFWMTSNQFGLMPETSGALALARMGTEYDPSKTVQWRWGASLAANYGIAVGERSRTTTTGLKLRGH